MPVVAHEPASDIPVETCTAGRHATKLISKKASDAVGSRRCIPFYRVRATCAQEHCDMEPTMTPISSEVATNRQVCEALVVLDDLTPVDYSKD
jgi:hypothetical protein